MAATIIISVIVAALLFLAVRRLVRRGACCESGKGGCRGNCSACAYRKNEKPDK